MRPETQIEGQSLSALAKKHNLPKNTLYDRWRRGERGERLIRPSDCRDTVVRGKSLSEWAWELTKATGGRVDRQSIYNRMRYQRQEHGYSTEKALAVVCNNYLLEAKKAGVKVKVQPLI